MLTSAVKHRHQNGYGSRLAVARANNPFEVCVVLVRRHRVLLTVKIVSYAVVAHVANDKQIPAPDRFGHDGFAVARREARIFASDDKRGAFLGVVFDFFVVPVHKIAVDTFCKFLSSGQCYYAQRRGVLFFFVNIL